MLWVLTAVLTKAARHPSGGTGYVCREQRNSELCILVGVEALHAWWDRALMLGEEFW